MTLKEILKVIPHDTPIRRKAWRNDRRMTVGVLNNNRTIDLPDAIADDWEIAYYPNELVCRKAGFIYGRLCTDKNSVASDISLYVDISYGPRASIRPAIHVSDSFPSDNLRVILNAINAAIAHHGYPLPSVDGNPITIYPIEKLPHVD